MGGTVKSVVKSPTRALLAGATGGLSEFAQKDPFGAQQLMGKIPAFQSQNQGISGPFNLDPFQLKADQEAIAAEGQRQFNQTQDFINQDTASRTDARNKLAEALTKQSQDSFQQSLPSTMEDLNARHLLNGSGLGQELARQQGQIATNIADQVGVQGAQDINTASGQRAAALAAKQGFDTGGLQRGLSLEDFVNQSNVAKSISAQMAPPPPTAKQNFGTTAQGIGAIGMPLAMGKAGKAGAVAGGMTPYTPTSTPVMPSYGSRLNLY